MPCMGAAEDELVGECVSALQRAMTQAGARRQVHRYLLQQGWTPPPGVVIDLRGGALTDAGAMTPAAEPDVLPAAGSSRDR